MSAKKGRPSKLSETQWEDLLRKLASGEKAADLARFYGVSPTTISKRVSQQAEDAKRLAFSLAQVEGQVAALPVSQQRVIRNLADELKSMREDYIAGAAEGLKTAKHLNTLARQKAETLTAENLSADQLRVVAALSETANRAAAMGSTALRADKGPDQFDRPMTLQDLVTGANRLEDQDEH